MVESMGIQDRELVNETEKTVQDQDQHTKNEKTQTLSDMTTVDDIVNFDGASAEEKAEAIKAIIDAEKKSEADRRVNQALQTERIKREKAVQAAREEAERAIQEKAILERDNKEELLALRDRQIEEMQAKIDAREHTDNVNKLLANKEVPVKFHEFVHAIDADIVELDSILTNFLDTYKAEVDAEVQRRLAEALESEDLPGGGEKTKRTKNEPLSGDTAILAEIKGLTKTADEHPENWEKIMVLKNRMEDPTLAN